MTNRIEKIPIEVGALHRRKALTDDRQQRGSMRVVDNLEAMFKIPHDKRKIPMEVRLKDSGDKYMLISEPFPVHVDTTIVNWQLVTEAAPVVCSATCVIVDPINGNDIEAVTNKCVYFKTVYAALDFIDTVLLTNATLILCAGEHIYTGGNWARENINYEIKPGGRLIHTGAFTDVMFDFTWANNHISIKGEGELIGTPGVLGSTASELLINVNGINSHVDIELKAYSCIYGLRLNSPQSSNINIDFLFTTGAGIYLRQPHKGNHRINVHESAVMNGGDTIAGRAITLYNLQTLAIDSLNVEINIDKIILFGANAIMYNHGEGTTVQRTNVLIDISHVTCNKGNYPNRIFEGNRVSSTISMNVGTMDLDNDTCQNIVYVYQDDMNKSYNFNLDLNGTKVGNWIATVNQGFNDKLVITGKAIISSDRSEGLVHVTNVGSILNELTLIVNVTGDYSTANGMHFIVLDRNIKKLILLDNALIRPNRFGTSIIGNDTVNKQLIDILDDVHFGANIDAQTIDYRRVTNIDDAHFGDVNLYVDVFTGNDYTGDGSATLPYSSVNGALRRTPRIVNGKVSIHIVNTAGTILYGKSEAQYITDIYATEGIEFVGSVELIDTVGFSIGTEKNEVLLSAVIAADLFYKDGNEYRPIQVLGGKYYIADASFNNGAVEIYKMHTGITSNNGLSSYESLSNITFKHLTMHASYDHNLDKLIKNRNTYYSCHIKMYGYDHNDISNIDSIEKCNIKYMHSSTLTNDLSNDLIIKDSILHSDNNIDNAIRNIKIDNVAVVKALNVYEVTKDYNINDHIIGNLYINDVETNSGIFNITELDANVFNKLGEIFVDDKTRHIINTYDTHVNENTKVDISTPVTTVSPTTLLIPVYYVNLANGCSIDDVTTRFKFRFKGLSRVEDNITSLVIVAGSGINSIKIGKAVQDRAIEVLLNVNYGPTGYGVFTTVKYYISYKASGVYEISSAVKNDSSGYTTPPGYMSAVTIVGDDIVFNYTNTDGGANNHYLNLNISRIKFIDVISI